MPCYAKTCNIVHYECKYILVLYKTLDTLDIFVPKKVSKLVHQLSNSSMTKQIFIPNQEPIFISSIKSWRKLSWNTKPAIVYKVHDSPPILNKRRDICIAKGQARGHSALKTEKIVQNIKCIWKGCGFTKYLKAYIISPPFRSNHKFFWVYFCYLLVWFP